MKRFLSFLALTLLWPIWRAPAWAQLTTLGVGGVAAVAIGMLTPPRSFRCRRRISTQNGPNGFTNNGLQPNGGAVGAMQFPSDYAQQFDGDLFRRSDRPVAHLLCTALNMLSARPARTRIGVSSNRQRATRSFSFKTTSSNSAGSQWWNALATDYHAPSHRWFPSQGRVMRPELIRSR